MEGWTNFIRVNKDDLDESGGDDDSDFIFDDLAVLKALELHPVSVELKDTGDFESEERDSPMETDEDENSGDPQAREGYIPKHFLRRYTRINRAPQRFEDRPKVVIRHPVTMEDVIESLDKEQWLQRMNDELNSIADD